MTEPEQTDAPEDHEEREGIAEMYTGDESDPDEAGYLGGTAMMRD